MSLDVQLTSTCPHLTLEERVQIELDRKSLYTRQPVSGHTAVRILVNDEFYIPQGGLRVPAHIQGFLSGPFRIAKNKNTLTVQTNRETITLNLPLGTRVTTDRIVSLINQQATHIISSNNKGKLFITDSAEVGRGSRIHISGTALSSLGFEKQWGAKGKDLYPGWDVYLLENTLTKTYVRFRKSLKTNPVIKVTYKTPPNRCLRCRGVGIENDSRYDIQGNVVFVENENLLYQAAIKILMTDLGSNPYHTWYGGSIRERIGGKALSSVATIISEDVRNALNNLQQIQLEQAKYQPVTLKERLYRILSVQTYQSEDDPTVFLVDVTVQNASSDPVELTVIFTVPTVIPLINRTRSFG